jgi:two-component system osmolarity sensor histidine kinase EnvZ
LIVDFFKNFLPKSLLPRLILIIIIPTLAAHLLTAYIFYQRHLSTVNNHLINNLADNIAAIVKVYELKIQEKSQLITQLSSNLRLFLSIHNRKDFISGDSIATSSNEIITLKEKIKNRINYSTEIYYINKGAELAIEVKIQDFVLKFITPKRRIYISTTHIFIMWLIGAAVLFAILSIIFVKNQVTPLKRLSKAVEQFGKGQSTESLKLEGAREVRKAALAFLRMKSRIEKHISHRMEMLAGVSHDLRTPITRIKLQLEMVSQSSEIIAIKHDLMEMENMIQDYLSFARGEDNEMSIKVYINEYLLSIIKLYNIYNKVIHVDYTKTKKLQIDLKLNSFKRALVNILDNAVKYSTQIHLSTQQLSENLMIIIEDNGPGIKKELYKEAFKPFSRLDPSRNLNKGGAGLGLSIARDIISNHGGEITLDKSDKLGGLKVIITLPC